MGIKIYVRKGLLLLLFSVDNVVRDLFSGPMLVFCRHFTKATAIAFPICGRINCEIIQMKMQIVHTCVVIYTNIQCTPNFNFNICGKSSDTPLPNANTPRGVVPPLTLIGRILHKASEMQTLRDLIFPIELFRQVPYFDTTTGSKHARDAIA